MCYVKGLFSKNMERFCDKVLNQCKFDNFAFCREDNESQIKAVNFVLADHETNI